MSPQDPKPPGYLLQDVSRLLRRRFEELSKAYQLTLPQVRVLAQLARADGLSQVVLAGLVETDPMTLSGILDRLEKRGLIERIPDPADSRAKLARPTSEGKAIFAEVRHIGLAVYESAFEGVSASDHAQFLKTLAHIHNNLSQDIDPMKDYAS